MLVRVYTNNRQAIVKAAAGAIIVREFQRIDRRGYGDVLGFDISVVPAGPRGMLRRPPILAGIKQQRLP